ncbi:MAG: polyprenyl synthetase family protein [Devosiaceae bacterium]|nr:polyprenyl synthetase family protein [Devosiaceae bacterium MH13]
MGVVVPLSAQQEGKASLERVMALSAEPMQRVNQIILGRTGSDVQMIPQVAQHLIDSGGKRLRPILTVLCGQMFGYGADESQEGHLKLAASVEFMHTATLLHDDVVDESDMRRGKPAARMVWGNQASVLVGDFLLGQAFQMMVEVGSLDALQVLSHASAVIAEGEVMQLTTAKNTNTTEDDYLQVIKAKTAALFSAACEVGPIVATAVNPDLGEVERSALRSYGTNLGLAFQLVDDALDYGGSAKDLGKDIGDDFRERKVTLPVILAYRRSEGNEKAFWERVIVDGDQRDGDLERGIRLVRERGGLADTISRARHFGAVACDALDGLPQTEEKAALLDAVAFCIDRVT